MKVPGNRQRKSKETPRRLPATPAAAATHIYYFGSFCLNQTEQQLLRDGEPVRLAPKAFELLRVLVQNSGSLVSKEKLLEEVWPGVFVEEANLSVNVANLRKTLDQGNTDCPCIETVPKRGYRFVAQVSELTYPNYLAVLPFQNEG